MVNDQELLELAQIQKKHPEGFLSFFIALETQWQMDEQKASKPVGADLLDDRKRAEKLAKLYDEAASCQGFFIDARDWCLANALMQYSAIVPTGFAVESPANKRYTDLYRQLAEDSPIRHLVKGDARIARGALYSSEPQLTLKILGEKERKQWTDWHWAVLAEFDLKYKAFATAIRSAKQATKLNPKNERAAALLAECIKRQAAEGTNDPD
jgi:hypothetical protein